MITKALSREILAHRRQNAVFRAVEMAARQTGIRPPLSPVEVQALGGLMLQSEPVNDNDFAVRLSITSINHCLELGHEVDPRIVKLQEVRETATSLLEHRLVS